MSSPGSANARAGWRVGGMVVLSLALHGAALASLARGRRAPARDVIAIEVVSGEPRRPTPAPPPPPPPAPPPRPRAARTAPSPRLATAVPLPPAPVPAGPEAPPPASPFPRVGISLASTVSAGGFAFGVGDSAHGRAEDVAADPATVRPRAGVAAARLSAQPRPIALPPIEYPADARRAGTQGRVVLALGIDAQGRVTSARVVEAPSPSLAGAAQAGARSFRFTPALLEGAPVATEIRFTYTFQLD